MADDDSSDKSHEPSQRKLDDARKKGEIPRSPDLLTAASYFGVLITGLALGQQTISAFGLAILPLIEQPDRLRNLLLSEMGSAQLASLLLSVFTPVLPWLVVPGILVVLVLFASRGIAISGEKLAFKFNRLSLIENAKNKYGRRGLFEFVKSFSKLILYSVVLCMFIASRLDEIIGVLRADPREAVMLMSELMLRLLSIVVVIAISLGAIDYLWQRGEHMRRNRMSQKELRDEYKEAEGDPMFKQHRRARAQEIAMNQMMADVPDSDVVIVNPTHYSVALKWSRKPGEAPVCVAKGVDQIALRIREIAQEHDIPILSDPPTARALYATTEIGEQIKSDHFRPVAAAIRFSEDMRKKVREKKGLKP
ncbi:EscU/YscU/HrcU family type III secretion system export apparatus switch protein [Salipiger sp.]|uniref:EscU/YscU/HrcU family type III secretion system export apparatus switch protein n=1 Tax=Salipiger sp. TaxID=2078585 RepID=UPI003A9700E5